MTIKTLNKTPQITRKTLLYKSKVEYTDFCINHIEGCAHGCRFPCYAMLMKKRYGLIKNYNEWIKPKIVSNALELLDKELPKYRNKIKLVHLCFSTDPFMYKFPDIEKITLDIIERLNKNNIRCTVLTKGTYPQTLINNIKYSNNNEYGITIVSLNEEFKRKFEPFSASCKERIDALRYLHSKGLKTWISMEPYPTPNLINQDLLEILKKISFVDKIIFGKLNYNINSSKYVFKEGNEFYEYCANKIISFCKKNGIKYHIKYGTQKNNNTKTEKIFKKYTSEDKKTKYTKQLDLV